MFNLATAGAHEWDPLCTVLFQTNFPLGVKLNGDLQDSSQSLTSFKRGPIVHWM